ncbi:AAA family ATPase [Clostridium butyricum]|uniref:hypothetical protein n=1 Tax=Clostridium butyricum TaxID=1492 RepID=UPI00374F36F7
MGVKLILDKLFVFSEKNKKYFYTEFDEKVNIIYGKNTAGKSTVFQTIFYALGINDNNELLKEILDENVVIRVDCRLCNENNIEKVIFVRSGDTVIVNRDNKIKCFYGINSNNSREHVKLKKYINSLFNFTLRLENKDGYKEAPIETIFLPYYICQSVGWVYLMKSFSGLEFYKNFRNDYLDFYLGVEDYTDRVRKRELETNLNDVKKKIEFYENFYTNDEKLQVSKLVDEKFKYAADEYLKNYINMQSILQKKQEEYVTNCNTLSYYRNRQALLKKINKNHEEQNPINGNCPMCKQPIKFSIEAAYKYFQEKNDTETELNEIKKNIKSHKR